MGKDRQCLTAGLRKGPWSATEDELLTNHIQAHGEGQWSSLPIKAGLRRCGKSCRLRWMNYLRPGINKGDFAADEDDLIIRLHRLLGNRWSLIAGRIPGRTDNQIKNYWNSHLSKKVHIIQEVGIGPTTNHSGCIPQGIKHCSSDHDHNEDDVNGKKKLISNRCKKNVAQEGEKVEVFSPKPVRVSSATVTSDVCNNSNGSHHDIGNATRVNARGNHETFGFTDAAWLNSLLGTDEEMMECLTTDNLGDHERSLEEVYEEYLRLLKTDGENVFDGAQLNY